MRATLRKGDPNKFRETTTKGGDPQKVGDHAQVSRKQLWVIEDDASRADAENDQKQRGNAESRGPRGYDAGDSKDSLFRDGTSGNVPAGLKEAAVGSGGGSGGGSKRFGTGGADGGSGNGGDGGKDKMDDGDKNQGGSAASEPTPSEPLSVDIDHGLRNSELLKIDLQYQAASEIQDGDYEEALKLQLQMVRSIPSYITRRVALDDVVCAWQSMGRYGKRCFFRNTFCGQLGVQR